MAQKRRKERKTSSYNYKKELINESYNENPFRLS
jgi:hypothetical protein